MVTRQHRTRHRLNQRQDKSSVASLSKRPSRLILLLSILALTTSLLIALQISRFQSGKGNIAVERLFPSLQRSSEKPQILRSSGDVSKSDGEVEALRRRLGAIGKQFQEEIANVKKTFQSSHQAEESKGQAGGMSIIPGESTKDHPLDQKTPLQNAPHVSEKSDEEAAEDQKIGLQDLDQDTLKAMFDALYSRS